MMNNNASELPVSLYNIEEQEDNPMPWEEDDYIPCTKSGTQKTPNMIRNQFQKYLDNTSCTQTSILEEIGVHTSSFRRFMNPKTYKNQWKATENQTYWKAAKFLDKMGDLEKQNKNKKQQQQTKKRKSCNGDNVEAAQAPAAKSTKTARRAEVEALMVDVASAIPRVLEGTPVYDSCPQVIKKVGTRQYLYDTYTIRYLYDTIYPF